MNKYSIYALPRTENDQPVTVYFSDSEPAYNPLWGLPEIEKPQEYCSDYEISIATSFMSVDNGFDSDGNPLTLTLLTIPARYEIITEEASQQEDPRWLKLRASRDYRLQLCDWTQLTDCPLSSEDKAAWATYRQALRDLPSSTEDPSNPSWPEEPN